MMKTKYGKEINPDDFPYFGQFGDYVRKNIDSEWGKDKEREITKKRKYEVYLNAVAEVSMVIFLEAGSEEEAEEIAKQKAKKNYSDWSINLLSNVAAWKTEEECNSDD